MSNNQEQETRQAEPGQVLEPPAPEADLQEEFSAPLRFRDVGAEVTELRREFDELKERIERFNRTSPHRI